MCFLSMLFAFASGLTIYSRLDRPFRILTWLLGATFVVECGAFLLACAYGSNLALYNVFLVVQFCLVALFFNYSIDTFRARRVGIWIALVGAALGVGSYLYSRSLQQVGTYFQLFVGIAIVSMALYSFTRLIFIRGGTSKGDETQYLPHFWVSVSFAFFWSTSFLLWGLYEYFTRTHENALPLVHLAMRAVNMLTYSAIGLTILHYRSRSNRHHV